MDWTNPDHYEFTKNLGPIRWAWEFLRRNQEYRQDWRKALDEHLARQIPLDLPSLGFDCISPDDARYGIRSEKCARKWGLMDYCNPDTNEPIFLDFVEPSTWLRQGHIQLEEDSTEVAIVFDLSRPIKPQIEHARRNLLATQKKLGLDVTFPKNHKNQWITYLRILDASTSNASINEIAEKIFPPEKLHINASGYEKTQEALRQAREWLRPSRYMGILMLTE